MKSEIQDLGTEFISMQFIERNPEQPRVVFEEAELQELADSIDVHGLLQPIALRQLSENRYIVIAGERRWRAHKLNNAEKIKACIFKCTDSAAYELTLIENLKRKDLNLLEEARGYVYLKDQFKYTLEEMSKIVGKSPSSISNIVGILKEDIRVQEFAKIGVLTIAVLVWLKQLPNLHEKIDLLKKLEIEEVKKAEVKAYVRNIVKAYKIAAQLGVDPAEILANRIQQKGPGGRFDIKDDQIIPEDFRFCFIVDNLISASDLEYFPKVNILVSAFSYLHNKSANKQLARILVRRSQLVETLFFDSGVVPACKKKQWGFFENTTQLHTFYETVEPDICVGLDVPAYAPVFKEWGLTVQEVISKTVANMEKFRDWKPEFPTVKLYPIQGVSPEDYLDCFGKLLDAGIFDPVMNGEEKAAVGFGSIARNKADEILRKLSLVLNDSRFQKLKEKLEFVHGFGVGQPKKIVKLYQEGINSFDALTCTILTATGQYWLRNGYYYHIIPESPHARRIRMLFNVNGFWGILTEEFAKLKGMQVADEQRKGLSESLEKLEENFEQTIYKEES